MTASMQAVIQRLREQEKELERLHKIERERAESTARFSEEVTRNMPAGLLVVGANGLIINQIGDQSIGAIGHGSWSANLSGNYMTGFGTGMSTNMMLKIGSAVAIYAY